MSVTNLQPQANERLECNVAIAARPDRGREWHASMEMPKELMSLDAQTKRVAVQSMLDTLGELQRLNEQTEEFEQGPEQPWMMLQCLLWLRRSPDGVWRVSVSYSWPDIWLDYSRETRSNVLRGIGSTLDNVKTEFFKS